MTWALVMAGWLLLAVAAAAAVALVLRGRSLFNPEPQLRTAEQATTERPQRMCGSRQVADDGQLRVVLVGLLRTDQRYCRVLSAADGRQRDGRERIVAAVSVSVPEVIMDREGVRELLHPGDVGAQTTRTLQNVEGVLRAGGATFDDVVMLRVYLTTRDDFAAMNDAYAAFLAERVGDGVLPARTTVMVELPRPDMLVEIDALAVLDN